ncbi:MAG: kelch repeat-containing protein [Candidatus Edwardsbacteria bacterium]|nr:kelch repeat-containing protein [Candidatus Edwardsbacteria bacterium]
MINKINIVLIIAILAIINISGCSKDNPVSVVQDLVTPILQLPADQATNSDLSPLLQWQEVSDAVSYSVQLCVDSTYSKLLIYKQSILDINYQTPQALLTGSTRYYWRVRAINGNRVSSWSKTWSFLTNNIPIAPKNPFPADGILDLDNSVSLSWVCSDIDPNDTIKYDVYLNDFYPPTVKIGNDLSAAYQSVSNLTRGKTYYWRVVAKDNHGNQVSGPIWSFSTRSPWMQMASMRVSVRSPGCILLNGSLYAFGGWTDDFTTNTVQLYGIYNNTWVVGPSMVQYRSRFSAATVINKIYILGGFGFPNLNEEYDPATGLWSTKADMPTKRVNFAVATANGIIYVMGGDTSCSWESTISSNIVEAYDPIADSWTTKAPMLLSRKNHTAAAVNGKIYVFGGNETWNDPLTNVDEYDPATNTWTSKSPIPTPRYYLSSATSNGIIYAMGGLYYDLSNHQNYYYTNVEAYDPVANSWTQKTPMPTGKFWFGAASDNNFIYTIGGDNGYNCLNEVYKYDPLLDQ